MSHSKSGSCAPVRRIQMTALINCLLSLALRPDEPFLPRRCACSKDETGRGEQTKNPLTVLIEEVNDKYGTKFTEIDKVLLQLENDYASQKV